MPKQQNEAMKFYRKSRPTSGAIKNLATRNTSYKNVEFPAPPEGEYSNYEEFLASQEYENALQKLAEFSGIDDIGQGMSGQFAQLSMQAMSLLAELKKTESSHREELQELAVNLIRKYFQIPERALTLDFKLNPGQIKFDTEKINPSQKKSNNDDEDNEDEEEENEEMPENGIKKMEEDLADIINSEELNAERAQRRLQNAMTQGLAVDSHWIFRNVEKELIEITGNNNIVQLYSLFTAVALLGYWQYEEGTLAEAINKKGLNEAVVGGKTYFTTRTTPPTVFAEAAVFPFLIHEGLKGVMEFLGDKRNPQNKKVYQKAVELEDQIKHELWDIRLGPEIWRKFYLKLPFSLRKEEGNQKFIFYIVSNVANLPSKEFLILYKEIFSDSKNAKKLLSAMYYDLTRMKSKDEVTTSESEFKKLIKELSDQTPDDDIGDMLKGLGISLS